MSLYQTIFEWIDVRSFSSIWYWLVLACAWTAASYQVVGVPFGFAYLAKQKGGDTLADFEAWVGINVRRMFSLPVAAELVLFALWTSILTVLFVLGVFFGFEFAQASFLIAFPISFVALININTAMIIRRDAPSGEALYSIFKRHKLIVQILAMVSVFATALWGMYQNIAAGI